jgi:hypothetical protein
MRRLRLRFTIRRMMFVVAVLGVASWTFARYPRNWTYYASGWWAAECELWRGEVTIYGTGGLVVGDICNFDEETGLPVTTVGSGCRSSEGDFERVNGHNDHVAQYIRWHGLPKNTLKPWEHELFNLARFFDDRSRTDVPKPLVAGGPALVSPDGKNSVRPVAGVKDDGSPSPSLKVVVSAGNVVLHESYGRWGKGDSDLLWGPEGSRFAVIRSISENTEHYVAYDLRTGGLLRGESWDVGENGERVLNYLFGKVNILR